MDPFRPEYVDAVNAAAWNHWFFLALAVPPLLLIPLNWYRFHWALITVAFLCAAVLCLICFGLGVEYIWHVKEIHAQTTAEHADVTADTAKVFAPALIGVPYAIFYTTGVQLVALIIQTIGTLFQRATDYFKRKPVAKNAR